jgi:virulence-associated protein VapD
MLTQYFSEELGKLWDEKLFKEWHSGRLKHKKIFSDYDERVDGDENEDWNRYILINEIDIIQMILLITYKLENYVMAQSKKASLKKVNKKAAADKAEIAQIMRTQILLTAELLSNFLIAYDDYKLQNESETLRRLGAILLNVSESIQAKMSDDSKAVIANRVDFIYNCWIDLGFVKVEDEQRVMEFIKGVVFGE